MSYIGNEPIVSATRTVTEVTATAGQTVFNANGGYTVGYLDVFLNGSKLTTTDFTATNGSSITLTESAQVGDIVRLDAWGTFSTSNLVSPNYTGTLTGGTGVVNIGSGQVYKTEAGNVGIGTSSPVSQLHLVSASDNGLTIYKSAVGAGNVRVVSQGGGSALAFGSDQSIGTTERMRIDSSGNVGIGTSSPANRLSIGTGSFASATAQTTGMYTNGTSGLVLLSDAYSFNSRTGSGFMTIDSSGNLLVGTTSTGSTANGFQINNGSYGNSVIVSHNNTSSSGVGYIGFYYSSNQIGSITQNGTTAVAYNTSSDYRLKENIAPMTGALATVSALKPVTYKWKSDGSAGQGFIAHELQAVVPDCVTGEKDGVETYLDEDGVEQTRPKYQGIDTSFLVATLTAAIQEQQVLIQSQADTITAMEVRLTALEGKQ
jgi:hypothetical protein